MILEHEIPKGSKLHFGLSARLKREVESASVALFYAHGFEEILSPIFVYQQHQKSFLDRNVIHLSSEKNYQVSMRNDSTTDVIRIVTKRLGRATSQKKWFYIQPVFSYPTIEFNQIGAECLDESEMSKMLELAINLFESLFKNLNIRPILQITNTQIAKKCAENTGLEYEHFVNLNVEKLQSIDFIARLLKVNTANDLDSIKRQSPAFLKDEIETLIYFCECAIRDPKNLKNQQNLESQNLKGDHNLISQDIKNLTPQNLRDSQNIICSPLLCPPVDYYDDLFFKMFLDNWIFLLGGRYCVDSVRSCGFGIYTDNVVYCLLKQHKG